MTRRRRPGSFTTRSNDVGPDDAHDTLTLAEYRRTRGLDHPVDDGRQADDDPGPGER
jgi:hypothetical protein